MEFANHEQKVILEYQRGIRLYKQVINNLDTVLSIFENSPWGIPKELESVFKESQGNETLSKLKGEVEYLSNINKMIEYRGELYPTRVFRVDNPEFGESQVIRISVMSLWENIMHGVENLGSDEETIDDEIYYYVDDEVIDYSSDEICNKYLDIPMKFIEEISEEYLDN